MALVSLADVKAHMDYPTSDRGLDDAQIGRYILAAGAVIRNYCGDVEPSTYTERYDGGDSEIWLRNTPVVAISSLSEAWGSVVYPLTPTADNTFGFTLDDPESGRVTRRAAGGLPYRFMPGIANVLVTYSAGMAAVPEDIKVAALRLVASWWRVDKQASMASPGGGQIGGLGADYAPTSFEAGVPYAILELLKPYRRLPGLA